MARVGVAHPGTQHSWQTALAFQEGGDLRWYATSYYFKPHAWPEKSLTFAPAGLRSAVYRELGRRHFDPLQERNVRRALESEFLERPLRNLGLRRAADALMIGRHRRFPDRVIKIAEDEPVEVLWGTHDSLEAFEALKPKGVLCILDQPIGHFSSLDRTMREEFERHPEWFYNDNIGVSPDVLDRQKRAADLADLIVVGSAFTARTMVENGCDPSKIRVLPYGYDERLAPTRAPDRAPLGERPVEFVFVGRVGARKGLAYLLPAFQRIDPNVARLTIVGPLDMPFETLKRHLGHSVYAGQALRADVYRHMTRADCFIFPSLFEGGGIVLYEAAACGLGIIQTDRCGDGVRADKNGVSLSVISVDEIVAAVERACEPKTMDRWRNSSWEMRSERSWDTYRGAARNLVDTELMARR